MKKSYTVNILMSSCRLLIFQIKKLNVSQNKITALSQSSLQNQYMWQLKHLMLLKFNLWWYKLFCGVSRPVKYIPVQNVREKLVLKWVATRTPKIQLTCCNVWYCFESQNGHMTYIPVHSSTIIVFCTSRSVHFINMNHQCHDSNPRKHSETVNIVPGLLVYVLNTLDTICKGQRPVSSLGVYHHMHEVINL